MIEAIVPELLHNPQHLPALLGVPDDLAPAEDTVQTVPQHPFRQWILPPIDGGWRALLGRVHEFKKQELLGRERQSRLTSQRLRTIEYQGFLGV